eukprot:gene12281-biopygen7928
MSECLERHRDFFPGRPAWPCTHSHVHGGLLRPQCHRPVRGGGGAGPQCPGYRECGFAGA